ncbi:MAG: alpha/beta hydrolase-fold protein [Bacteroidota bacterium]
MKKFFIAFFLFSIFSPYSIAQAAKDRTLPVTLNRTETHRIVSEINGVAYPIFVSLPGSYYNTDKIYPVVYLLDAYSSFGIVTQMAKLLAFSKELPELIIVGISSEGGSKEFNYNRARDYTPTYIDPEGLPEDVGKMIPVSGGAEKFLGFIEKELIPFIESKYRFSPGDRTLIGHSLGGLFVSYVLISKPALFNRYVMISPALFWDNNLMIEKEKEFFEREKSLDVKIYSTVGSLERPEFLESWRKFFDSIKIHNYEGMKLKTEIAENETHYTIIPRIVTKGLINVFGY